jgi:hypothetical protein
VLLRLAYLGVTNVFALLRLLLMNSRDKDAEILALRHQLAVRENPGWGYRRVHGELLVPGVKGCRFHRLGDPARGRDRPGA